jgi:hypothetical protein
MCWYDAYWRRKNNVQKFDELLSFSFEKFSGERRVMSDGTRIEPGDCLAIIHFNRECFASSSNNLRQNTRNALRFRRLILSSFKQLAKDINENEKFIGVKAFHGVSWIPPHGEKLGFVIERVPDSALNFIRKIYLTVLLKTFFPNLVARDNNPVEPHAYWLTRHTLIKNFSTEIQANEYAINQ